MLDPPPDADPVARHAIDALRSIVRALRLGARVAERDLGLSVAQLFVLQQLADGRGRSITDLARLTRTDKSSVSVVVARLVDEGLVTRATAAEDARRAVVTLSDAGRARLARGVEAPQERLLAAIEQLPEPRRRALAETLAELAVVLGDREPALFFEEE